MMGGTHPLGANAERWLKRCPRSHVDLSTVERHEVIEPTDTDYPSTGLKARSVVRLSRLASVETSVINAKLGEISIERLGEAKKRVIDWLQK